MVKKKVLSLMLAFCMLVMLIPATVFAADEAVDTLADLNAAITNADGTEENPTVITISGQIEVNQTISIPSGKYIKFVGETQASGLIRAGNFTSDSGSVTNISHLLSVQGSLELENITIDGNNRSGGSLVFVYGNNAIAVMNEGTTLKNNLDSAVTLYSQNSVKESPCRFVMNGGTICNNSSSQGGGVAIINYGYADFTMNGGTIKENTATSSGGSGAIYSCASGTVTINNGRIINNKNTGASDGGALNITGRSALVIAGGEISNNQITSDKGRGGGIYKSGNAPFTITGGVVENNSTARSDGREGQDIYIASGDFMIGGAAHIPDGLFIERYNNSSDKMQFYITSPLQYDIGIEGLWTSPSAGRVVAVGKDYTITQKDINKLSYNHASLGLKFDKDNNRIILGKPSYTVTYTLSNMTFTGTDILEQGEALTTTLDPSVGFHSTSSITVEIGGAELDSKNYQAVAIKGGIGIYIPAQYITGNVEIIATAAAHTGGTATCTAPAVCEVCGQSYGEKDMNNHTGTVVWIQTEATHKQVYNCCQTQVSPEENHTWENGKCTVCSYSCSHTGGEATCSQLAVCEICGSQYGELNPDNHKAVSEWTQENGKHYHKCAYGCDTRLDEADCSGGTATCTSLALCEICGQSYGSVNPDNHIGEIVWTQTAATHSSKYDCCDTIVAAEEAHKWENGVCSECGYTCQHTGGEATCAKKTICKICGEEYGEVNASNHTNLVKIEAKLATHLAVGNTEYWYCDGCDKYLSDEAGTNEISSEDTVIQKLTEHTTDGTGWHFDKTKHWNTCECGATLNEAPHIFKWVTDKKATATKAGSKHEECTVCGYVKAVVEIPATETTKTPSTPSRDKGNVTNSPKTGDESNIAFWLTIMLAAGATLTGTVLYSRKKKYNR